MTKINRSLLLCVLLLTAWGAMTAFAQQSSLGVEGQTLIGEPQGRPLTGEELDRVTNEVSSRMRCPVCQGLSVADSPTPSAVAMKAEVRQFLAAGYTDTQILTYFEQSYGEFIRLEPKAKGFNLLVWILPIAALLGGLALVIRRTRRPDSSDAQGDTPTPAESDLEVYLEQVRREVSS
ncbi:MAG: cytochrome c-type biogenesis protein [Thermoanaerobaculia bacterium]